MNESFYNSAKDIVLSSLAAYGGKQKNGTTYKLIICPFHDDNNPSLSVNISKPGLAVGTFNCWGCSASGNWNKLAEKCGFPKIKSWQNKEQSILELTEIDEIEMMGNKSEKDFAKLLNVEIITDWNPNKRWRGFSGSLMKKLGAKLAIDKRDDTPVLLCPVSVGGVVVGYVKALMHKKKGKFSYISSKGPWIKDKGLFPYDYIKKKAKKKGYLVLVEGPRDALRLITEGIPALAVFGVQAFGKTKATYVSALGDITIYIMPDNDEAGDVLYMKAKEAFKELDIKIKRIKLPRRRDKEGKIIKLDPCSAPIELIENLRDTLRENHE
jgi:5S rRNA maturation endonuclease (ribonuclease M5)